MNIINPLHESHNIARRYFVVNGFDGALTMLGIIVGFYFSESVAIETVIHACMGAAIALGISGVSSAYMSEVAERKKELRDLENAMIQDLSDTTHEDLSKTIPIFIAVANGISPFIISLIILIPLFLSHKLGLVIIDPLLASLFVAFSLIFLLGVYLGKISRTFWLWSGLRTLLIALLTTAAVYLIS